MKTHHSSQRKNDLVRKVSLFYILQISLTPDNRTQLDSLTCFCIQSVGIGCFWLKYVKKNWPSYRQVLGKRRRSLIDFSNNYGYSLLLYQNLTVCSSFLKVKSNMESETTLAKSYSLFYKTSWIFYSCMIS